MKKAILILMGVLVGRCNGAPVGGNVSIRRKKGSATEEVEASEWIN